MRGILSSAVTRATESRFAKPVVRVVLAAAGLLLLAFVGRTAVAGAFGGRASDVAPALAPATATATSPSPSPSPSPPAANPTATSESQPTGHVPASKDDPVVLNTATTDDLRRLPGIGEKRATAILALRARLGRFRAVDDLLKVKGIGRATLRRLRPLIRLDAIAEADAGAHPPTGG